MPNPLKILRRFFAFLFSLLISPKKFIDFLSSIHGRTNAWLYILFFALLLIIFGFLLTLFFLVKDKSIWSLLSNASLMIPFVWITSHVNRVINRRTKVYLEYEHKKTIVDFYTAFKPEFDNDPKLKELFYRAAIDVVMRFPSAIGERRETDSPLDKLVGAFRKNNGKKTGGIAATAAQSEKD